MLYGLLPSTTVLTTELEKAGVGRLKLLPCGLITASVKSRSNDGLRPVDDRQSFSLLRRASAMQLQTIINARLHQSTGFSLVK
jgi:hypothetical protein